jgi:hypothetical protein
MYRCVLRFWKGGMVSAEHPTVIFINESTQIKMNAVTHYQENKLGLQPEYEVLIVFLKVRPRRS